MARQREMPRPFDLPGAADSQQTAIMEAPEVSQDDPREAVIADLKRRLEQAQAEARAAEARAEATAPQNALREPGLYRVSLNGVRCRQTQVVVEPHERRPHSSHEGLQASEYDALDLFLRTGENDVQKIAWQRYAQAHGLDPVRHRPHFRVRVQALATVDHLDIPAVSAADAEMLFKKFNRITNTQALFMTQKIDEEHVRKE